MTDLSIDPAKTAARSRACEGCREAKIRCRASSRPNTCQKCLESKKECVVRTGPRTRRPRKAPVESSASSSTSPAPSKDHAAPSTFTIDFPLSAKPEPEDTFNLLRSMHEKHIETILPPIDSDGERQSSIEGLDMLSCPAATPTSSTKEHSITDLDGKPQFNFASAVLLLDHFRTMLPRLPCIEIPYETTVQSLASTRPFLLLAILTSASAAKSLQGHRLYDSEFRKVLGLKYVATGERTLELLQGLLVYCIWYPFQVRPQSPEMIRYVRMVSDLVQDLGLDRETADQELLQGTDEHRARLRAFLGYSYLQAVFISSWRPAARTSPVNDGWVLRCCDTLGHFATGTSDLILVTLAREGIIHLQAATAMFEPAHQTEDQRRLLLLGLQTRSRELQQQVSADVASSSPVKLTTLFLEVFLNSVGLLHWSGQQKTGSMDEMLKPDPVRVANAVAPLGRFLDYVQGLDEGELSSLTTIDWARIVIAIIVAIRLSLPNAACPGFDCAWARSQIQLNEALKRLCSTEDNYADRPAKFDALSATRVVLTVVQRKFEQRVQAAELQEAAAVQMLAGFGCPFLDGSLSQYMSEWEMDFNVTSGPATSMTDFEDGPSTSAQSGNSQPQPVFHDMWATMTMSWANKDL